MTAQPRGERGAVAIIVCAMATGLVMVAALCVDLGMQRVVRADMQSVADLAALDMARLVGTVEPGTQAWRDALTDSLGRNATTLGRRPAVAPGMDWVCTAKACARAVAGWVDSDNAFSTTAPVPGAAYNGVRVEATADVDYAFSHGDGGARRLAVARSENGACFDLGSYAAGVSTGDSALLAPLSGLLGLDATLGLVSYQGLAAASVTLGSIAAAPTIGTPAALLDASGVSVGRLIDATIVALQHDADASRAAAAIGALELLRSDQSLGVDLSGKVKVGDLVGVDAGDAAALATDINVLDLIGGALSLSNGSHLIDSGHTVALPGIGSLAVGLTAIQGTQRMCGRANDPAKIARQSQLTADVAGDVTVPVDTGLAGILGTSSVTATGRVSVTGGVGNAEAQLVSAPYCGQATIADPDAYDVRVWSGLLGVRADARLTLSGSARVAPLSGLLASVEVRFNDLQVSLTAGNSGTSAQSTTVTVRVPQNASNTTPAGSPSTIGQPPQALTPPALGASLVSGTVQIRTKLLLDLVPGPWVSANLGDPYVQRLLAGVVGPLDDAVLAPVVSAVNGLLLPLSELMGIRVPGADVYAVARPSCGTPVLAG